MRNNNTFQRQRSQASTDQQQSAHESGGPDYIAMQYRFVRVEDGWKTRKEQIGSASRKANGSICFRPTGQQLIDNDVHLFPSAEHTSPENG